MKHFLVHDSHDNVGVAVVDINAGEAVEGTTLDRGSALTVTAREAIPLGHKIALRDFRPGDTVVKYGEDIGKVVAEIRTGQHVHVHNLKTKRW
ncbi:MAG: UxaA family hydrolase [Terriglobia bacterium]